MPNVKVVLWSAGSGAVIALIAALFGRVGLPDLILRTLIGGAAFALLGAAIYVILMRFIPEMFEPQETEDEDFTVTASESGRERPAAQQGSNLNIVLEGDEYNYAGEEGPEGGAAEAEGAGMAEASSLDDEDDEFVEEVEEVEEIGRDGSEPSTSAQTQTQSQAPAQAQAQSAGTGAGANGSSSEYKEFEDLSDVDTLPDLDEFSDSFESVAASQEAEGGSSNGGGYSSSDSVDIMGDQQDPATVAKAVRTIIGKDQEG